MSATPCYARAVIRCVRAGGGALGGVGVAVDVEAGGRGEPGRRLLGPAELGQDVGVGVPEPDRTRSGTIPVQAAAGEHGQGSVELAEVAPRAGDDDEQLGAGLRIEPADVAGRSASAPPGRDGRAPARSRR